MTSDSAISASPPEDTFHVRPDDEEYLRMLREEEEFWDSRGELLFLLDGLMCNSGRLVPGEAFGIYGKRCVGDGS